MDTSSTEPEAGTPGTENTPGGGGPTDAADRAAPGAPPAASNQPKSENLQTAPDVTGAPGTVGSADPQSPAAGGTLSAAGSAVRATSIAPPGKPDGEVDTSR